jgi:hypothetical protein
MGTVGPHLKLFFLDIHPDVTNMEVTGHKSTFVTGLLSI